MRNIVKKLTLMLAFCLILSVPARADENVQTLTLAELTDVLARNKGKVVMLNFFATWCPPCRAEIPDLIATSEAYKDRAVVLVGLSVDEDKAKVSPFMKKMGMTYPVYHVDAAEVAAVYNIRSIPHNVFYGKDGSLVLSAPGVVDSDMLKMILDKLLAQ